MIVQKHASRVLPRKFVINNCTGFWARLNFYIKWQYNYGYWIKTDLARKPVWCITKRQLREGFSLADIIHLVFIRHIDCYSDSALGFWIYKCYPTEKHYNSKPIIEVAWTLGRFLGSPAAILFAFFLSLSDALFSLRWIKKFFSYRIIRITVDSSNVILAIFFRRLFDIPINGSGKCQSQTKN